MNANIFHFIWKKVYFLTLLSFHLFWTFDKNNIWLYENFLHFLKGLFSEMNVQNK